ALSLLGLLPDNAEVTGSVVYLDKDIINSNDTVSDKKMRVKARRMLDQRLAEIRWKEISMIFQGAMNAFNPVHTIRNQIKEVFEIHNTFSDLSNLKEEDFIDEGNLRARANEMALEDIKDKESAEFKIIEDKIYDEMVEKLRNDLKTMSLKDKKRLLENNRMESSCRKAGFNPKFLDAYPHELSGGMKQRGIIAMALALNPKVVIADEPTTGLDVITQAKIIKELKGLKDSKTIRSMIVISHDVGVVSQLANYVAVMYAGRVMEYGEPKDLFVNPRNPYTYALMHSYPSIDATKQRIHGIPGSVPDLIDPPKGCYFASRCFMAEEICHREKPPLRNLSQDHKSLCHFDQIDEERYLNAQRYSDELLPDPSAGKRPVLLEAKDLSKYFSVHSNLTTNLFGGANKPVVHAVDMVNLLIRKKVIIGVVGESGSGKTTLGKLLVNAIEPTSGKLIFRFDQVSSGSQIENEDMTLNIDPNDPKAREEIEKERERLYDIALMSKKSQMYSIYRKENQLIFQDPYDSINPKMSIFDIVAEPLLIQKKDLIKRRQGEINNGNDTTDEDFDIEKEVLSALDIA
ncbi:MAG: ATP-binding cassette domain-containing protein, partial [Cuniculiplasma sp.]|nr:ATP-binding cassette domain-containing protein [Cuniculiplasma sp.]